MLFGLVLAHVGLGLAIWLLCACVVVPIAGLVAAVKSEGAALAPFSGFGICLWIAIQILGAKHTIYSGEVLHWAPRS